MDLPPKFLLFPIGESQFQIKPELNPPDPPLEPLGTPDIVYRVTVDRNGRRGPPFSSYGARIDRILTEGEWTCERVPVDSVETLQGQISTLIKLVYNYKQTSVYSVQ